MILTRNKYYKLTFKIKEKGVFVEKTRIIKSKKTLSLNDAVDILIEWYPLGSAYLLGLDEVRRKEYKKEGYGKRKK